MDASIFHNTTEASIYRGPHDGRLRPGDQVSCMSNPKFNGRDLIFEIVPPLFIPEGNPVNRDESYWIAAEGDLPENTNVGSGQFSLRDDLQATGDICAHDWNLAPPETTNQPFAMCQGERENMLVSSVDKRRIQAALQSKHGVTETDSVFNYTISVAFNLRQVGQSCLSMYGFLVQRKSCGKGCV